jgi:hypothetical protein
MRVLAIALPILAVACAPEAKAPQPSGQSLPEALTVMCDVDRLASIQSDADPLGAGAKRTAWVNEHVENPDGIELRTLMSVKGASEQAEMLRARAKAAGITRCALADALEKSGVGGLAP